MKTLKYFVLAQTGWIETFFRRVEVCWPIHDLILRKRIIAELEVYLKDNRQAWILQPDGSYSPPLMSDDYAFCAQETLLNKLARNKNSNYCDDPCSLTFTGKLFK